MRATKGAEPAASDSNTRRKYTWKTYEVDGPLFFGSTQTFSGQFAPKDGAQLQKMDLEPISPS